MVEDVLDALLAVDELAGILLISDDPSAELLAHKYPIEVIKESELGCSGLNAAVEAGRELLAERGIENMLIVHSDIPLLGSRQLCRVIEEYRVSQADMLLVPDRAGGGTNLLLCKTAEAPEFAYGPGSCQAHSASARDSGLKLLLVEDPGIGLDVDEPEDLLQVYQELRDTPLARHTRQLLLESTIAQRLEILGHNLQPQAEREQHDAV
jgi:2-phospho-L-lactate guanylyltransferase